MVVFCIIYIINYWSFKLFYIVVVYLLNYILIMMWRYVGIKYIVIYLKIKLKLRMYFLKIMLIFILIFLNFIYYFEFNFEVSWGGCKFILLLNYCISREIFLVCFIVVNYIMFLYFNVFYDDKFKIYNII